MQGFIMSINRSKDSFHREMYPHVFDSYLSVHVTYRLTDGFHVHVHVDSASSSRVVSCSAYDVGNVVDSYCMAPGVWLVPLLEDHLGS